MKPTTSFCVFLFAATLFGLSPAANVRADSAPAKQLLFPPANTPEARLVRVQIGPHVFDIPRNARDIVADQTGKMNAMSMRIVFPTMEGRTRETADQLDLLSQESRALQILISDGGPELPPSLLLGRVLRIALTGHHGNLAYVFPLPDHIETTSRYGLTQFLVKHGREGDVGHSIAFREKKFVFADLKNSIPITFIECSGEKKVPNPGCDMRFAYHDLAIKVGFRQSLLTDWRAIRDSFTRYLDERRGE